MRNADCGILAVADFSQVHPGDDPEASGQPLQQQPDDGGPQEHPQQLREKLKVSRTVSSVGGCRRVTNIKRSVTRT